MNNYTTNDKYICEEFCYYRDLRTFPSQLFAGENLNYILSKLKTNPDKYKKKLSINIDKQKAERRSIWILKELTKLIIWIYCAAIGVLVGTIRRCICQNLCQNSHQEAKTKILNLKTCQTRGLNPLFVNNITA